jgi:hypothetical protein
LASSALLSPFFSPPQDARISVAARMVVICFINDYFEREEIEELIVENEIIAEENNQESLQDKPQDTINRNFSVNIPDRKKNQIQRIGSNKEIRDGDNGTIFFNKK